MLYAVCPTEGYTRGSSSGAAEKTILGYFRLATRTNTTVPTAVDWRCWCIHEQVLWVPVHLCGARHDLGCREQSCFPFVLVLKHLAWKKLIVAKQNHFCGFNSGVPCAPEMTVINIENKKNSHCNPRATFVRHLLVSGYYNYIVLCSQTLTCQLGTPFVALSQASFSRWCWWSMWFHLERIHDWSKFLSTQLCLPQSQLNPNCTACSFWPVEPVFPGLGP